MERIEHPLRAPPDPLALLPRDRRCRRDLRADVTYIAVSSLGERCTGSEDRIGCDPTGRDQPHWVTVPLLYSLGKILPGLIPRLKRRNIHT